MVTDYDCWHEGEAAVTGEGVMEVLRKNVALAQRVVRAPCGGLDGVANDCANALAMSLITEAHLVPEETLAALAPIVGKYLDLRRTAWKR
jgi:5'-methylthioadenosine phosphorylase